MPSINRLGVLYISASLTFVLHHMTSFWQWIVSRCEASINKSFKCASVVWLGLLSFCACTTKVTAPLRKKGADLNPIHSLKQSHFDWPAILSEKKKKEYIYIFFFFALSPWDLEFIVLQHHWAEIWGTQGEMRKLRHTGRKKPFTRLYSKSQDNQDQT